MIKGFSTTQVLGASGVTLSPSNVWDDAGVTFTGIKFNVTNTASATGSRLLDLQVNGSSLFRVEKSGAMFAPFGQFNGTTTTGVDLAFSRGGVSVGSLGSYSFTNGLPGAGTVDLALTRDSASTLAQRSGTNAQTSRIYGTYTDTSNYRRVAIAMTTGGVASIAPEGAGTGASGNVLHISGLPTANPGPGILWNDGGTVKVGT